MTAAAPPDFRDYGSSAPPGVRELYRLNHQQQTLDFVLAKKRQYLGLDRAELSVWDAIEYLNTLSDESDPDTELPQLEHALQSAEAIRRDGHPRWFILTGLIHDLGKVLCKFGEPQWAVVGDTFPVGCAFSDKVVYAELFADNPDTRVPAYGTPNGIYTPGAGLEHVHLSWGHDEYLFHVVRDYLPDEALYMIRYHSFYAGHRDHAYDQLMNARDHQYFEHVRAFNPYDLYSKAHDRPDVAKLLPFYRDLVAEFFPAKLRW